MKLELGHVASSAATLMVKRDAEIRIPFGAGTMSRIPAVPPPRRKCLPSDEIRLVMLLV